MEKLSCYPFDDYSPYAVLRRHPSVPLYDPLFYNYGRNKDIFFEELRYYCELARPLSHVARDWFVLREAFVVDLIHPKWKCGRSLTRRSMYRSKYEDNVRNGVAVNPFLRELRFHEMMERKRVTKMPLCQLRVCKTEHRANYSTAMINNE